MPGTAPRLVMTNRITGAVDRKGRHSFIPTMPADFVARQFLSATDCLGQTQEPFPKRIL